MLLVARIAQWLVVRGLLRHWAWQMAVPIALAARAIGFAVHQQHGGSAMGMVLMSVQHRTFAIALALPAASVLPSQRVRAVESAWLVALLAFGLMMIAYRETWSPMSAT